MRNILFSVTTCILAISAMNSIQAQQKEVGLALSSQSIISGVYKVGLSTHTYLKGTMALPSFGWSSSRENPIVGFYGTVGLERRLPIGKRWNVYGGIDMGISHTNTVPPGTSKSNLYVLPVVGIQFQAAEHLILSADLDFGWKSSIRSPFRLSTTDHPTIHVGFRYLFPRRRKN